MQYYCGPANRKRNKEMRRILLIALLLPSIACAAEWVELGDTPEARVMIDKKKIENLKGNVTAWLKFAYRKEQPGQNVTKGKPFDSSINEYYVVCSARKFQVLQLFMFNKNAEVGYFMQPLNMNNLDEPKAGSAAMLLMDRVCPTNKPAAPASKK